MIAEPNSLNSMEGVELVPTVELNEDGSVKTHMLKVGGEPFRCECGCNCFHRMTDNPNRFICNACEVGWSAWLER